MYDFNDVLRGNIFELNLEETLEGLLERDEAIEGRNRV